MDPGMGMMEQGMGQMGPIMGSPEIAGTMLFIHAEIMSTMSQMMQKYGMREFKIYLHLVH